MSNSIRAFQFIVTDAEIADLHQRIDRMKWPDEVDNAQWSYGAGREYVRELAAYWRHGFKWREAESRINSLPQYLINIDGLDLHYLHCRSPHANATPLLITHGWPGSVVEFLDLIPRLTHPESYGGTAADAFHVIAPSLQGYGGSPPAQNTGMSPLNIAKRHAALMQHLGYSRYLAQGGDWGSLVAHHTAVIDQEHCAGLHLNLLTPIPPKDVADPMTLVQGHERSWLDGVAGHVKTGTGYYEIQRSRSQTLAYALTDSAVGWCAWVAEKFHFWSDCERDGHRDLRNAVSWDDLLSTISLYWFTGTIASSIRLYQEQAFAEVRSQERPGRVQVPTGVAVYPGEIFRCPRGWAERRYPIVHWYEAPHGGHFAAMEQPELFAADLRRFRLAVSP